MAADKVVVIPLGGEKATGDAVADDVLDGKMFSNKDNIGINGSMVNNEAIIISPSVGSQTIPEGYHNGTGVVEGDNNLIATNVRIDRTIFGVRGNVGLFWGCLAGIAEWDENNCYINCYAEINEVSDCTSFCNTVSAAFENASDIINLHACKGTGYPTNNNTE